MPNKMTEKNDTRKMPRRKNTHIYMGWVARRVTRFSEVMNISCPGTGSGTPTFNKGRQCQAIPGYSNSCIMDKNLLYSFFEITEIDWRLPSCILRRNKHHLQLRTSNSRLICPRLRYAAKMRFITSKRLAIRQNLGTHKVLHSISFNSDQLHYQTMRISLITYRWLI